MCQTLYQTLEIWDEYGNIVSVQELVDPGEKNKVGNV
jgi:hypothetical protein